MALRIRGAAFWSALLFLIVSFLPDKGACYKILPLLIALLSTFLVYGFAQKLTGSYAVANLASLLWAGFLGIAQIPWQYVLPIIAFLVIALLVFDNKISAAVVLYILTLILFRTFVLWLPLILYYLLKQRRYVLSGILVFVGIGLFKLSGFHFRPFAPYATAFFYIESFLILIALAFHTWADNVLWLVLYSLAVFLLFPRKWFVDLNYVYAAVIISDAVRRGLISYFSKRHYNWADKPTLTARQQEYLREAYEKQRRGEYSKLLREFKLDIAGKSVVDVGCGPAHWLLEAEKQGATQVVGLDMDVKFLKVARQHLQYALLIRASADNIPLKQNLFDVALSMLVIPYVTLENKYVQDLRAIIKTKGYLLISGHGFGFPLRYIFQKKLSPLIIYIATFLHWFLAEKVYNNTLQSVAYVKHLLRRSGFRVRRVLIPETRFGLPVTYIILAQKQN